MAPNGQDVAAVNRLRLWQHRLLFPLATGLGYYLGAALGVAASTMSEGIAIFWLPNGILLAALLLVSRREWPPVLLAAVVAEIAADLPAFTLAQALGFAAVNLLECLLAAWLLQRAARPFALDRLRHVVLFGVYALGVACGLAAVLGASIYTLSGQATTTSFWAFWAIWWLGDGMGVLLITPLLLGWLRGPAQPAEQRRLEATVLFALTLLLAIWIFSQAGTDNFPRRPFLLFPLSLWAAIRFGVRGTASIGLLISAIAITATLNDVGPLLVATPADTVLLLQEYLAVLTFSSLALAALLQELRERNERLRIREMELHATHDELDRLNRELEARVAARTRELQQANQRLEALASIDPLTGVSNRRHFLEQAGIEISRAKRQALPLSVIMLDIDFFKSINDRFGHEAGDKVLVTLADTIHAALRSGDIFARLGGEEFIVMLPGQGISEAFQMAERLRLLIAQNAVPDYPVHVTVSAGVAGLENEAEEIDDLLRRADQGLYRAKSQGRNQVCLGQGMPPDRLAGT
ncbi:sensor domain-containing diguanylate cyclase [Thiobacillus denitrificans]|uniref:GGDEF domain-containing protein n=1 Tax=Thiobacillus denitrificans TaxID=36861 RepID=UPI0003670783|nr:diguanylate cyclase [Thiobacillus denitrificans]